MAPRASSGVSVAHQTPWIALGPFISRPMRPFSIRLAAELGPVHDRRRDFLDRLRRRVEGRDAFARKKILALAHLVAAVVERRVFAVRTALLADHVQPLRIDRQAK